MIATAACRSNCRCLCDSNYVERKTWLNWQTTGRGAYSSKDRPSATATNNPDSGWIRSFSGAMSLPPWWGTQDVATGKQRCWSSGPGPMWGRSAFIGAAITIGGLAWRAGLRSGNMCRSRFLPPAASMICSAFSLVGCVAVVRPFRPYPITHCLVHDSSALNMFIAVVESRSSGPVLCRRLNSSDSAGFSGVSLSRRCR